MNWTVLGELLPKAVGVAISPTAIIVVMLMLISARARTNGPAFAVGWAIGSFTLPFLSYLLSDSASVGTDPDAAKGGSVVQVILGVLFLWFAWSQWKNRPRAGVEVPTPKLFQGVDKMSVAFAFGIGAFLAMVNAKNTPLGISVGVEMAQAGLDTGEVVSSLIVYALIAASTVIIPVLAVLLLGDRVKPLLDEIREWLIANSNVIMAVLFLVLGAKMLGSGLALFD